MAEENYEQVGRDPEQIAEEKGRKRRRALIIVVGLLLLLNGFLGYLYFTKKQEAEEKQKALISTKQLKNDLQEELSEVEAKNENLQGANQRLDSLLAKRDSALNQQASKIKQLTRQKRITVRKYKEAREQLEQLRYYKEKYKKKIDSLVRVNKELREKNYNLKTEVRETKQEKDQLKDKNVRLENKVAQGSRLKLKEARVIGVKIKNNGKKKETDNTNQMDQIKVCFNFQENPIADKGPREMLIRLLNANGETIHIESRGSGQFSYQNDTTLYTFSQKVKYENEDKEHCVRWSRGSEYEKGKYTMQIFTSQGYKVGETSFELKSGFLNLF